MLTTVIIALISAFCGVLLSFIFFKQKEKQSELFKLLTDFKSTIEEYKNQSENNTKEVKEAVKSASQLTKILTTNQNLKGKYGEDCLENVLKAIFPNKNIDYIRQFETTNDENKKIKPDYLINLPNDKSILIDCKLNLEKFIEYQQNEDTNLSTVKKNEFIKDINTTINNLANKKYQTANINQPDFILMYIPLEPVLTAIYTDKDFVGIIKNADEKNIIIVGTAGVLTVLRLIKLIWAQNVQDKNIENIINSAQTIYELIARHSQNLYTIKTVMEENLNTFNKEYLKITSDNKLFKAAQQLNEYGIQASKIKIGKKINEVTINSDFLK